MIANKLEATGNSIEEVLENANMYWVAEQHELITGTGVSIPAHKALVRSDNSSVLGVVGKGYQPMQNNEAFALMDELVKMNNAKYEYLYELDGGSKIIAQAKIDNDFEVRNGDSVQSYITMINSFDGSSPVKLYYTPIRLWCSNQLRGSVKNATESISIRHTKNIAARTEEAMRVLGMAENYFESFKEHSRMLAQKVIDKKMIDKFLEGVIGKADSTRKENQYEDINKLIAGGMGNDGSSFWDAYN